MAQDVSDHRSNSNDQIAYAAKVLGRSKDRIAVFVELHRGLQHIKTATQVARATGLPRKRVLEEAIKLVHKKLVTKTERDGEIAYQRDGFLYAHKAKVLSLARDPKKLNEFPTKYTPRAVLKITVPKALVKTHTITIDKVDSFAKARKSKGAGSSLSIAENKFKKGVQSILGELGTFKDWGGETSDLYTTRLRIGGTRHAAAFAFKGKATTGVLVPGRLGKNGDQIQRLFIEDADVFFVQYGGQVASTVLQQMAVHAQAKSLSTGRTIYYGVIDGADSARLVAAYPKKFRTR